MITFDVEEGLDFRLRGKGKLRQWLRQVVERRGRRLGNLGYLFCSDEKMLEVNREFLQHDYYTDIITFDYDEGPLVSGDMYIGVETVRSNAEEYGQSYERELHRVIVHGVLHLCGLGDKTDEEAPLMRAAEEEALRLLEEDEGPHT